MGFGRVAKHGTACVILDTIVILAPDDLDLHTVAQHVNDLPGWTVTSHLRELHMLSARRHTDDLTLQQLEADISHIRNQAWAKDAYPDTISYVVPKK